MEEIMTVTLDYLYIMSLQLYPLLMCVAVCIAFLPLIAILRSIVNAPPSLVHKKPKRKPRFPLSVYILHNIDRIRARIVKNYD